MLDGYPKARRGTSARPVIRYVVNNDRTARFLGQRHCWETRGVQRTVFTTPLLTEANKRRNTKQFTKKKPRCQRGGVRGVVALAKLGRTTEGFSDTALNEASDVRTTKNCTKDMARCQRT